MRYALAGLFLAMAAALGFLATSLAAARGELRRLDERLSRVIAENRLRRPGEGPIRKDPKDLATWAAEIDRLVQESYGQVLRLTLSEAQIRSIVSGLERKVDAAGAALDLANPQVRSKLKEAIDAVVTEHLYEKGYVLKRRTPSLDEVAERIGLAADQREPFAKVFSETRTGVVDLAERARSDGVDLLGDLYRLESLPWASPERESLSFRILATKVAGDRTFHDWLIEQQGTVDRRLAGLLTDEQRVRMRFLNLVPWDLVGISLTTKKE